MQIFVRTLDGKIITLNVESSDTIEEMEAHEKMFYGCQCLMHDLKSLAESHTLAYYNIDKESTLVLTNTSTIRWALLLPSRRQRLPLTVEDPEWRCADG